MFQTKPTIIAIIVAKPFKFDNVPVNVVIVFATCSQVLEHIGEGKINNWLANWRMDSWFFCPYY
jgi:hypothetical protein